MALSQPPSERTGWLGYDWFKLIVAIILLLLLLVWWLGGGNRAARPASGSAPTAAAVAAVPPTTAPAPTTPANPPAAAPTTAPATAPTAAPPTVAPTAAATVAPTAAPASPTAVAKPAAGGGGGPTPLAITAPAAGGTVNGPVLTLTGTGTPGSEVEVLDNGLVIGKATIGADGAWRFITAPGAGAHRYSIQPVGNAAAATAPIAITVGGSAGPLAITGPATGLLVSSGEVTLTGTAPPNSQIELADKGFVIGTIAIGGDGRWAWTARPISGPHSYIARLVGQPATVSNLVNVAAGPPPSPIQITGPSDGARQATNEVTLTGTAPPNSQIELLDKGAAIGTMTVGGDGRWSWTARPVSGPHSYQARLISDPKVVSNQVAITAGP